MRLKLSIALAAMLVVASALAPEPAAAQTPFRPIAVVNDAAITGFDLEQRMRLLSALGYPAERDTLRNEALDQLVEDALKLQAGESLGIRPTEALIADGIAQYAQQAGVSPDAFRARLQGQGVTDQALDDWIGAQLVWLGVIRTRFGDQLQPGEDEIDGELPVAGGNSTSEYRILEIGMPLSGDGRSEEETRALAGRLADSLSQGGDFADAVARYSHAASAERGGDVGWIKAERLPPQLRALIDGLQVGQVSAPFEVSGGLSIIKLVDRRTAQGAPQAGAPSREAVRSEMINQRGARLAEGLLQEMRRDALIEVR